jgi:hypothetical protein
MQAQYAYRPFQFFSLTFALSWIPWFAAAYFSYWSGAAIYEYLFSFIGLLGPFLSTLILIQVSGSDALKADFRDRLFDLRRLSISYLPVTVLAMPMATVIGVWLTHHLGWTVEPPRVAPNAVAAIPIILLAPAFEELGWRGYGVDSLRAKFGMLSATLAFAVLWAIWHVPLFFISHTYQHDLTGMNPIYVVNFFASILPAAFIANWLYYKHDRLILAAILFHFMLDVVPETLSIDQITKCAISATLFGFALLIVAVDRRAFREGKRNFLGAELAGP